MKKSKRTNIKYIRNINRKKLILKIIYILLIIGIAYSIIYYINTRITKNNYLQLFGTSLFIIQNDSMEKDLNKNDLVIAKKVKDEDLKVDDIIAYKVNDNVKIAKIYKTIKIEGIDKNEYVTISNKALYPNNRHVQEEQIIGKVTKSVPILGKVLNILQAKITIFIILIILLLLLSNVRYREKMYRQRKKKKIGNLI